MRLERGTFVISIDTEMSWGTVDRRGVTPNGAHDDERAVVARTLDLFDRYAIQATWAVVGHLFLDRCTPGNGTKHPEIVRPEYPWFEGDWFEADPCTDIETDPTWYGADIVARIRDCGTAQELASHSFSHVLVGELGCTAEAFASELRACRRVAEADGVDLRSFVFPRNRVGHLDVLVRHGFSTYRERPPPPFSSSPAWLRPLLKRVDQAWPLRGSAVYPQFRDGGWSIPHTYLFDPEAHRPGLLAQPWLWQAKRRLRQAVRDRSLFHLWFHPHNLTGALDHALVALEVICREAARWRDTGRLDNLTMGALGDRLEGGRA